MFQLDFMKTLVIAPHPDDEVFGCGGLLHRLKAAGGEVYVLYMTVGTAADFSPARTVAPGCKTLPFSKVFQPVLSYAYSVLPVTSVTTAGPWGSSVSPTMCWTK